MPTCSTRPQVTSATTPTHPHTMRTSRGTRTESINRAVNPPSANSHTRVAEWKYASGWFSIVSHTENASERTNATAIAVTSDRCSVHPARRASHATRATSNGHTR